MATQATLADGITLGNPNVVIGQVDGKIGSGSTEYDANQLDTKALYQFTVPGWTSNTVLVTVDGVAPVTPAIASANDLWIGFKSGQTRTIVIDPDSTNGVTTDYVTYTVTAPNF